MRRCRRGFSASANFPRGFGGQRTPGLHFAQYIGKLLKTIRHSLFGLEQWNMRMQARIMMGSTGIVPPSTKNIAKQTETISDSLYVNRYYDLTRKWPAAKRLVRISIRVSGTATPETLDVTSAPWNLSRSNCRYVFQTVHIIHVELFAGF